MRQIAERAGVNRSTVSLALRNDHRLKLATRQKIQALATEMGYLAGCHANPRVDHVPILLLGKTDRAKFLAWYRRVKPEVILCIQEEILGWLEEEGRVVPRDVSLLHLDLDAVVSRKWAGMRQDRVSRGSFAVDLVVSQLNNDEMGPPSSQIAMLTESTWESGDTLALPPQDILAKKETKQLSGRQKRTKAELKV